MIVYNYLMSAELFRSFIGVCKMFEKTPGKNVSSLEVLQFLNSKDGLSEDLLFWRV
jgi:hypothetical protein